MITRDQQYSANIFRQVTEVRTDAGQRGDDFKKKYGSMAHKLPILVRTAGLAQALEFAHGREKAGSPQHLLLDHLSDTVLGQGEQAATLLARSRTEEFAAYMRLTQQVMAALLWYKRFAQSILDVDASEADQISTEDLEAE